jgi:hypothetical protein
VEKGEQPTTAWRGLLSLGRRIIQKSFAEVGFCFAAKPILFAEPCIPERKVNF